MRGPHNLVPKQMSSGSKPERAAQPLRAPDDISHHGVAGQTAQGGRCRPRLLLRFGVRAELVALAYRRGREPAGLARPRSDRWTGRKEEVTA
jgi:hypothetical protein